MCNIYVIFINIGLVLVVVVFLFRFLLSFVFVCFISSKEIKKRQKDELISAEQNMVSTSFLDWVWKREEY